MNRNEPAFRIEVSLSNRAKANEKLTRFDDLDESELDRIGWAVSGGFAMYYGDKPITVSPNSDSEVIDEYVWQLLLNLHSILEPLMAGEPVDQPILDNPGRIKFQPIGSGDARIVFELGSGDEHDIREVIVPTKEVPKAVVSASNDLIEDLLDLNHGLRTSELVTELQQAIQETTELIRRLKFDS